MKSRFVGLFLFISITVISQKSTSMMWQGIERTYKVFTPTTYSGIRKIPLVISLHPGLSNAETHLLSAKWHLLGDTANFITVYPNGTSNDKNSTSYNWNAYNLTFGSKADDAGFLNGLIDKMISEYSIDTCRIYISGFSNGAWMTWRMGCDFTKRFAAIGALSGSWKYGKDGFCDHGGCNGSFIPLTNPPSQEARLNCIPSKSIPYMYYRGTEESKLTDRAVSDPNGNIFWARNNKCGVTPYVDTLVLSGDKIYREKYENCKSNNEMIVMNVVGNSHLWHRSATEQFWKFFKRFNKCDTSVVTHNLESENDETIFFPNPVKDILYIESQNSNVIFISIFDINGKQVYSSDHIKTSEINLSHCVSGIYYVRYIAGANLIIRKILIQ